MKVALIGTAPLSLPRAPFEDQAWTIWACSAGNQGRLPRTDMWFELHGMSEMTSPQMRAMTLPYFAWLRAQTFPVYMQEHNQYLPQALVYPLTKMVERFGRMWFTSSVAYMMALAISRMEGTPAGAVPHEIGIFGVDMAADQEHYTGQRAGCLRFIEFAKAAGIVVTVPEESCLSAPTPLYGYNEASHAGRRLSAMKQETQAKLAEMTQQARKCELEAAYMQGALAQMTYWERTFIDGLDAELDLVRPEERPAVPSIQEARQDFNVSTSGLLIPASAHPVAAGKFNGSGLTEGAAA